MNQLHKIVWNSARQQYVVTSELARGRTKSAATSTASAAASVTGARRGSRMGLSYLSRALVLAGLLAPGLVLASTCKTGTPQQSAPVGGTCTLPEYNPPVSQNGAGGTVVTGGGTVTLQGMPNFGSGYSGNTMVSADTVNVVSGTFNSSALVTGPQSIPVAGPNAATGTNEVYRTFDSTAFTDQSNSGKQVNQFEDVSGDMYINASLGKVSPSGGTLNVNLGNTPTGAPSSNSIMMVSKQTYLTSADGTGANNSRVIWRSRNAIDLGIDPGLPTPSAVDGTLTVDVPVTTYAGTVAFNGVNYSVTNAAELAAYNNVLVDAIRTGVLTSQQAYDDAFAQAYTTVDAPVTYQTNTTAGDMTRLPNGDRYAILARGARGSAVIATGAQIDITRASGAVKAVNGATITNNGTLSGNTIQQVARVESGAHFINSATGVVSSGYLVGDQANTATDPLVYYTGSGVLATGAGTTVQNSGVINAAGFDTADNTSIALGLANGAAGNNNGTINVGVNPGFVSTVVGVNVSTASSFTNAADGTIYIGRAAQYSLADGTTDVATSGPAYGVRIMDTGDTAVNNGQITIGSLTQGAVAMYSTAPVNSLLLNNGTININGAAGGIPLANIGMLADDNGAAGTNAIVRNAGTININGVNGVGIKVNADPGIAANAESTGIINVNGSADPASGTRNFGVWVNGAQGVASISGALNLTGMGAIGAFAQNGGTINVAGAAVPQFLGNTDQIGFFAAGAGSAINVDAANLTVNTERSTMFRVADGAAYTGSSTAGPLALTISGTDARGVVATGPGTTLSTGTSAYNVTGAAGAAGGAVAIINEGGAIGTIDAGTTISLASSGAIAGIVDGWAHDLGGAQAGLYANTTLTNNASIQSATPGVIGFVARNQGTLVNNNTVLLTGGPSTGVIVGPQGTVRNNAIIQVSNGDGALVQGAGATLVNNGTIQADNGTAAVHLTGAGASVAFSGNGLINASGTANGILLDSTAVGGSVTGTAGRIVINGSGMALANRAVGGIIDLSDTTITTQGVGAAGISSSGQNGNISVLGGNIGTTSDAALGIYVGSAGTLRMENATITTAGAGAHGIMLDSGATAVLTGGSITATGANASGVYVQGPGGGMTVNGTAISGGGAGATTNAGATLALNGATLRGATSGVAVTDTTASGAISTITVTGGSVAAQSGNAFDIMAAKANIAVAGGASITAASGVLLNAVNGSLVNFDAQGVMLTGDLITDSTSTGTVTLRNGTTLTGRIDPVAVSIDNTSTWNVTANSAVTTLANAGTVAFIAPTGNPTLAGSYKTITAANYVGNNGTIALNTYLGSDGSPSDRLVINGGTATGTTGLRINNTGGPGALTTGNGINVVAVTGGGTTAPGAFRLAAPVQSGAYEYLLYRGSSDSADDYYLRSALTGPTAPNDPSPPASPKAYRPGVVGYALTPGLNLNYGFSNLGRLQERVGDIPSTEKTQKGNKDGVWGRIGGEGLQADSGDRFSVNQQTFFMQFGKDWTLSQNPEGGSTHAGITGSIGVSTAKFRDSDRDLNPTLSDRTGTTTTQAQSVGGYYTKYWQDGSYWDSVAQLTHYRNKYGDVYGNGANQNGVGVALSQEVGKPFPLAGKFMIEPQAQLVYQYLNLDSFDDGVSSVSGNSSNAVRGRLGFRIFAPNLSSSDGTGDGTPYLTFDVLHDFVPPRPVSVDGTSVRSNFSRTWAEAGAGISQRVGKSGQLYAVIKFSKDLDGEDRRGVFGQVGYRYSW
jgi:outer membrane autotransporter protein